MFRDIIVSLSVIIILQLAIAMETTTCKSECTGATAFVIGLTIVFTTIITVIPIKTKKRAHNIDLAQMQRRNGTSITVIAGCKDNMDHQSSRETRISESNYESDNEVSKGQMAVTVAATNKYVACGNSNKQNRFRTYLCTDLVLLFYAYILRT